MNDWHVTPAAAAAYADGRLDDPSSWSLEAHVEQCTACARTVSSAADPVTLARVLEQMGPRVRPRVRGLVRLTVMPALSTAWLVSVAGAVLGVLALDVLEATGTPSLLLLAPLLPLLGLAVGCSSAADRDCELLASTPVPTLYLLLLRSAAVLLVSMPPLLVVSLVTGTGTVGWLAPSAGLVGLALALTTQLRVEVATGAAASVWAVVTMAPVALQDASPPGLAAGSTAGWLLMGAASVVALTLRRQDFDRWQTRTGAQR